MHVMGFGCLQYILANAMWLLFRKLGGMVTKPKETLHDLKVLVQMAAKISKIEINPFSRAYDVDDKGGCKATQHENEGCRNTTASTVRSMVFSKHACGRG